MAGCCLLVLGLWFWVVVVACCLGLDCLFGGLRLRLRRVKCWVPLFVDLDCAIGLLTFDCCSCNGCLLRFALDLWGGVLML